MGDVELRPEDIRFEGYQAGFTTTWRKITHVPTGISITTTDATQTRQKLLGQLSEMVSAAATP